MRDTHDDGRISASHAVQAGAAAPAHSAPHDLAAPLMRRGLPSPQQAPDLEATAFAALLLASAPMPAPAQLRRRLLERVARSAGASRALHTRRHADVPALAVAPGVTLRSLYAAASDSPLRRPGEPEAVALVELAPGASWAGPASTMGPAGALSGLQREWLVLRGSVRIAGVQLQAHDYHVVPAGLGAGGWHSDSGALLYQREARPGPGAPMAAWTQGADEAEWCDYGPGIKRRIMWQQDGAAAMLYHALPGAAVPHHGHRHDEECFMLAGDFFLDDVLLRALDYQIAPAGTEHLSASTDTGLLIYAHGDVELDVKVTG